MDEPTGLPPLAAVSAGRLSSPSSAAGPAAPWSSSTQAAAGPQGGDGGLGATAPIQPDPRDGCQGAWVPAAAEGSSWLAL